MPSGCGRRPPDWLRSNDRLRYFEVGCAEWSLTPPTAGALVWSSRESIAGRAELDDHWDGKRSAVKPVSARCLPSGSLEVGKLDAFRSNHAQAGEDSRFGHNPAKGA